MNRPILWEEKATLLFACCALFSQQLLKCLDASASQLPHALTIACLLPVCAYFSADILIRLAIWSSPIVGWWLRGTLRWTSWWAVRAIAVFFVLALVVASTGHVSFFINGLIYGASIVIPTFLLFRHIIGDYITARRQFGSLAGAERAMHPESRRCP